MNKLFLSVFPVILLAFTVSGCNSTSGNEGSNLTGDEKSSAKIEFLTKETFKQKVWDYEKNQQTWVYEGKLPAIIDFYADWCRPCRMVAPILDELAEDYKGKVVIYKINTQVEKELAAIFKIQSIPSFLYIP
ncbi:MAG: thioredoxin domain-containing protein, partial [Bacteroidales bacterium]